VATFGFKTGIWYANREFVKGELCTTQVQQGKRLDDLVFGMPDFRDIPGENP
jgi:hypothetical protein